MANKKRNNIIFWFFTVATAFVFLYLVLGECLLPSDDWGKNAAFKQYSGQWMRVLDDGTRIPQEVPGQCKADRNESVILETKLNREQATDVYLCFRSAKQDMEIYVDGKLRRKYSTKETRLFGRTSAVAYLFCEIHPDDAGKTLQVRTKTDSSYSGIFYPVYEGNQLGIWEHYFELYGTELMIAFLVLILSALSIIASMILRIVYHQKVNLEYLGWGIFMAGTWLVVNSVFRQFLFPNLSVINDISFFVVMLLPLPYLFYLDSVQKERYHIGYLAAEILAVADFVICTTMHLLKWKDFTDSISYMSVVCVVVIVFMAMTILIDVWKGFIKEYRYVAIGNLFAFVSAIIQFISYFRRTNLFNGAILAIGLLFLLFFAILNTIGEILHIMEDRQAALAASEAKGRFLANMSHEIRTPINVVLGMDAMILRESAEPKVREYALDIQNAGQSLLALINDILDLSKIESGKLEIIPVKYDFSSLIHDVMIMITTKAENKGLQIQLNIDEKLPSRMWGDDVRLRQILINLLNNAVKYTEKGSVNLTIKGERQDNDILLTFVVEDTGIGIRKEDIARLFSEFERIEEQRNRNIEGTGLGISITTQLLSLMDSQLLVESEYGKGSKFYFTLKQGVVDEEPIGDLEQRIKKQAADYTYNTSFQAPDAHILVVDDNAVNRKVFASLLKETNMQIDEASGGLECLKMVQQKEYDIIFLDHMMSDIDGIETLRRMKEWKDFPCKDTPVVALTANAVSGAREMYLEAGFCNFLSKPIHPEKLEKMIRKMLPQEKVLTGKSLEDARKEKKEASDAASLPSAEEKKEEKPDSSSFPSVEGIDWEYALLHCEDAEILMGTVQVFCQIADAEAKSLQTLLDTVKDAESAEQCEQAMQQYQIKVHSMKSSAALIGAVSVSGVARMLEYAARDYKEETILQVTPVFLQEWEELKNRLKTAISSTSPLS